MGRFLDIYSFVVFCSTGGKIVGCAHWASLLWIYVGSYYIFCFSVCFADNGICRTKLQNRKSASKETFFRGRGNKSRAGFRYFLLDYDGIFINCDYCRTCEISVFGETIIYRLNDFFNQLKKFVGRIFKRYIHPCRG